MNLKKVLLPALFVTASFLTGCQTQCCAPAPTAATTAPATAPVKVAAAAANLTGQWHWVCCDGKYSGELTLQQDAEKLTGRLFDGGDTTGGAIEGNISGNTVKFTRSWGEDFRQDYTLILSGDGQKLAGDLDGTRDEATGTHFEATRK